MLDEIHELLARVSRRIERARLDERFQRFAVVALRVESVHEVVQTRERTVRFTLGDNRLGNRATNAAHAGQAEANAFVKRREFQIRRVHVGRQNGNARMRAARDVFNELVGVAHVARQHCGHVFVRVVRLQIRRAHNENRICGRVRFVERVLRELLGVRPNLVCDLERIAVFDSAVAPVVLQLHHDVELFLAHSLTQLVGLACREAAHDHRHLHDLLLVDHGAVGFFQNRAQALVVIMHGGFAARDLDIVVNHARLERARAVQRNRCDDVRETVRWEPAKQAHIQRALNLEQAVHIARSHKLESLRVFGRNLLGNKLDAITLFHVAARARKHAQRT